MAVILRNWIGEYVARINVFVEIVKANNLAIGEPSIAL